MDWQTTAHNYGLANDSTQLWTGKRQRSTKLMTGKGQHTNKN